MSDSGLVDVLDAVVTFLQVAVGHFQSLVFFVLLEHLLVGFDFDVCDGHFPLFKHGVVKGLHLDAVFGGHCLNGVHEELVLCLGCLLQC